jgi:hypothetical protein
MSDRIRTHLTRLAGAVTPVSIGVLLASAGHAWAAGGVDLGWESLESRPAGGYLGLDSSLSLEGDAELAPFAPDASGTTTSSRCATPGP